MTHTIDLTRLTLTPDTAIPCDSWGEIARQMNPVEAEIDWGVSQICRQLMDQRVERVARTIMEFRQRYAHGEDVHTAMSGAIEKCRGGGFPSCD